VTIAPLIIHPLKYVLLVFTVASLMHPEPCTADIARGVAVLISGTRAGRGVHPVRSLLSVRVVRIVVICIDGICRLSFIDAPEVNVVLVCAAVTVTAIDSVYEGPLGVSGGVVLGIVCRDKKNVGRTRGKFED
jgi:hypothetical protein